MNEAFAVFVERRVTREVLGREEYEKEVKEGMGLLGEDVGRMGSRAQGDSALRPMILAGENPEKSQS